MGRMGRRCCSILGKWDYTTIREEEVVKFWERYGDIKDMNRQLVHVVNWNVFKAEDDSEEMTATGTLPEVLLRLLSDSMGLYIKAHTAHWNVVGSDFEEYHALFGAIYEDLWEALDPLAENIRKLGSPVPLDVQSLVAPLIGAQGTDPGGLAADLLKYNDALIPQIKDAFDVATAARSQGIANFLAERQDMHEKWSWQLSSSLKG